MIFLDYQECDYEITPLADTFEDFIRGLISEEVYEPDWEEERTEE